MLLPPVHTTLLLLKITQELHSFQLAVQTNLLPVSENIICCIVVIVFQCEQEMWFCSCRIGRKRMNRHNSTPNLRCMFTHLKKKNVQDAWLMLPHPCPVITANGMYQNTVVTCMSSHGHNDLLPVLSFTEERGYLMWACVRCFSTISVLSAVDWHQLFSVEKQQKHR